jgi:3-oxoacyl-[acyl-carrier-protein] synthase III
MPVRIVSFGAFAPENRVTNGDLAARVDTSDEWIRSHTGIGSRHICASGDATSDLAVRAARAALEAGNVSPEEVDIIVVATASQDYPGFPSVACLVQKGLGAKRACAFDVSAGCTGFIYALEIAKGMLLSGSMQAPSAGGDGASRSRTMKALVIGADTLSRIVDWEDRATCVLFGDGAGAALLEFDPEGQGAGVLKSVLHADGNGWESLIMRRGGTREPILAGETFAKPPSLFIDGRAVYTFAVQAMVDLVGELLAGTGLSVEELGAIVPHQANARIIQAAAKRLRLPEERFYMNIEEYANTSAASIPIALAEMKSKGLLAAGEYVMTIGFGAGLTWGGNLIQV